MSIAEPLFFGPSDRPLFGWVHQPEGRRSRGTVILCPPLAREYISAHFAYRVLAEALAERDLTAIRFDYRGTGDSPGADTDPGWLAACDDSVEEAVELARHLGSGEIALVGMRMGAVLAARAAARRERVGALVLWDPCGSGREFLREQTALFRVRYGRTHPPDRATEIGGFVLSAETARDLETLETPAALPQVERALVLLRDDRRVPVSFGVPPERIEAALAEGQAELMDVEPFLSVIPPTPHTIAGWLDTVMPGSHGIQRRPKSHPELPLTASNGASITERMVRLGPHGLFGMATVPDRPTGAPTVLFLNSGNDPHTGPNRLWVELARSWAGLGFPCIRFDLSGLGDSPVRPGQATRVVRPPAAFDDVTDVVTDVIGRNPRVVGEPVGGRGDTEVVPVVLVGLCAGAYQALESAIELRPRSILALNPLLRFHAPETDTGPLDPRRRLCRPVGSLRSTYRALPDWKVLRLARDAYLGLSHRLSANKTAVQWLMVMADQGTEVLCVCGEAEATAFFEGEPMPPAGPVLDHGRARIEVIPGLDHGLIRADQRVQVAERLTAELMRLEDSDSDSGTTTDPPPGSQSTIQPDKALSP